MNSTQEDKQSIQQWLRQFAQNSRCQTYGVVQGQFQTIKRCHEDKSCWWFTAWVKTDCEIISNVARFLFWAPFIPLFGAARQQYAYIVSPSIHTISNTPCGMFVAQDLPASLKVPKLSSYSNHSIPYFFHICRTHNIVLKRNFNSRRIKTGNTVVYVLHTLPHCPQIWIAVFPVHTAWRFLHNVFGYIARHPSIDMVFHTISDINCLKWQLKVSEFCRFNNRCCWLVIDALWIHDKHFSNTLTPSSRTLSLQVQRTWV